MSALGELTGGAIGKRFQDHSEDLYLILISENIVICTLLYIHIYYNKDKNYFFL